MSWAIKKPFVLVTYGTSLTTGRLSGFWPEALRRDLVAMPEAVGPVVVHNKGKGSQTSVWGKDNAYLVAEIRPSHILTEGFAINDSALGVSQADHLLNMAAMRNTFRGNNPDVKICWQTMNGVSAAGAALRPNLPAYYADEVAQAITWGDQYLDNYGAPPSPPAASPTGWPKPLPDAMTDSGDGLHPTAEWVALYLYPQVLFRCRQMMAEHWGLPAPNPPEPPPLPDAEYLVAGGAGGGGGYVGGGGGAGGIRRSLSHLSSMFGYLHIGRGGAGAPNSNPIKGVSGEMSRLGSIVADGGGGGGGYENSPAATGEDGASGGGGGTFSAVHPGGAGFTGQGNNGGSSSGTANGGAGGGGGKGGAGANGANDGGAGGAGYLTDVPGQALTIAGGGPGGSYIGSAGTYGAGQGPTNFAGGGKGGGTSATVTAGDNGGDGAIWVWYSGSARATGGTVTSFGGFTVHKFTVADMVRPPNMTASNAPAGYVASADSEGAPSYQAFAGLLGGRRGWFSQPTAYPHWLQQQFPSGRIISSYTISGYYGVTSPEWKRAPYTWELRASNDPTFATYVVVDSRTSEVFTAGTISRAFMVANPGSYTCYRLHVFAGQPGSDAYCEIGSLILWTGPRLLPI